ncbi:histidine ammonia-lyase [Reichenbachiella faecimaris]|uniref:Histidine ammonia-lyase n=1 Tax=Reichenbachiella faecimaris TaxID=692418 RepID=A0A1W2GL36_REIFA|nr:histidine ammonia-lyase [Reichenbachiella faecimaris]SMD37202.1 histidine ammonia-lyase [Reichenbachiella faecimaris]
MPIFNYGIDHLTPGVAIDIAEGRTQGVLNEEATQKILASRQNVLDITEQERIVYGVNTGFGSLCTTIINKADAGKLQENILRSHSVGVGAETPLDVAKLMMILKVHALSKGYSGVALETLERIIWHIEQDFIPYVPQQGSVGASGDLAPLAHLFLPLIGEGKIWKDEQWITTRELFQSENKDSLNLGPKEGLALINGTQFIAAYALKGFVRMSNCLDSADIIGAMSLEALKGSMKPFDSELHQIRPYKGSIYVADRLEKLVTGSEIINSHQNCSRVQDPYSLRCMPQVHGASRNAWLHLKEILTIEINSVTDNPIICSVDKTISGGNFHGQPMAMPIDYASLASAEIGNISDRRVYLMLEGDVEGLPALLMNNTGLNSGFMIPQYTSAALVSENKGLCFPSSADSVPTSLGQEDHVSMGSIGGRKLNTILDNLENILGIELFCAAQGFDFRKPLKSSAILEEVHAHIRQQITFATEDRIFGDDMAIATDIIRNKEIVSVANEAADRHNINLYNHEVFGIY